MIHNVVSLGNEFHWLDVVEPSKDDLDLIARKYQLHATSVSDCLDPEHLPKFETIDDLSFVILRAYDSEAAQDADTIQELTRKTAIFFSSKWIVTIHRKDQPYFIRLREKWKSAGDRTPALLGASIFADLIEAVLTAYEKPVDDALDELENLEMGVFEAQGSKPFELRQGYFLKRRAFVYKRLLRMTAEVISRVTDTLEFEPRRVQALKEQVDALYFFADELMENINGLLNLYLSLSSQRTNEVMRVLTIISVFLLPLNVITGIYGMNFEHMPELKWVFGYPSVLFAMVTVLIAVYFGFRKKGWL